MCVGYKFEADLLYVSKNNKRTNVRTVIMGFPFPFTSIIITINITSFQLRFVEYIQGW